jgi:hypothetical protein
MKYIECPIRACSEGCQHSCWSAIADVQPIASQQAGVIAVLVLIVSAGRYGGLSGPKFPT